MRATLRAAIAGLAIAANALSIARADPDPQFRAPHLSPVEATDEGGLWDEMRKSEVKLKASAEVDHDPALNAYVRGVVCKIAADYCDEMRVYVLDAPIFQSYAAPNGYVGVYSGLLLRARTEDELAYVLGHEVSHFARNHTLARWRSLKGTANGMLLLSMGIGVAAAGASVAVASSGGPGAYNAASSIQSLGRGLVDLTYLVGVSRLFAFSRDQESEADRLGYERAVKVGYDPAAGPAIWEDVVAEQKASDFPKRREGDARLGIFDTHPLTAERIAALKAMNAGAPSPPSGGAAARYRAAIRPHLAAWLKDDLRRRDWGQSLHLLARLEAEGEDLGVIGFYRGEVYRQRRSEGDAVLARAAYAASTRHPDAPPEAWRELGEEERKLGDKTAARDAFTAYLAHAPEAQDRWLVEAGLKTL